MEPDKCEGWEWTAWENIAEECKKQIKAEEKQLESISSETRHFFQPIPDIFRQRPEFNPVEIFKPKRFYLE